MIPVGWLWVAEIQPGVNLSLVQLAYGLASVSVDSQRWPKPAFQRFEWPGLSSPRPAGRCLGVEAQAHRVQCALAPGCPVSHCLPLGAGSLSC